MNLLYLQPAEAFGGAERQGVLQIKHLRQLGFRVTAVAGPGRPIRDALAREAVDHYIYFPHFPKTTSAPMSIARRLRYFAAWHRACRRSAAALERRVDLDQVDLIVANRTIGWIVAAALARRCNTPYVLRAGSRPSSWLASVGLYGLGSFPVPPTALLANCEAVRQSLELPLRCPARVVKNAVDTDRFAPARAVRAPADRPALVVGLAARPAPEKGFDLLTRVVRQVVMRQPDVVFKVAGDFGWRPHFQTALRRAGLSDSVTFLGHVDDMTGFYADCDVVVLTSRARSIEGSPNALLEAMAMERPVVATQVGGVPELIDDGVEGFLVPDGDAACFAGRLLALLEDRTLRARMGRAGRTRVLKDHGVADVMARLSDSLVWAHALATRGHRVRSAPLGNTSVERVPSTPVAEAR